MGHTVSSQRIVLDIVIDELRAFSKSLRKEDREIFEEIINRPLKHIGSISYACSINVWAFLLIAIIIEQEKKLKC